MLAPTDLKTLTAWCHGRAMRWLALRADAETAVLLLEPRAPAQPWQRMRLLAGDHGFLLEDEAGQALVRASDLPALLDALDGGVADAMPLILLPARAAIADHQPAFA